MFKTGDGADTIVADLRGGHVLAVGSGASFVFANHAGASQANTFMGQGSGVSDINGFVSGLDKIGGIDTLNLGESGVRTNTYFGARKTSQVVFASGATLWFFNAHVVAGDISS